MQVDKRPDSIKTQALESGNIYSEATSNKNSQPQESNWCTWIINSLISQLMKGKIVKVEACMSRKHSQLPSGTGGDSLQKYSAVSEITHSLSGEPTQQTINTHPACCTPLRQFFIYFRPSLSLSLARAHAHTQLFQLLENNDTDRCRRDSPRVHQMSESPVIGVIKLKESWQPEGRNPDGIQVFMLCLLGEPSPCQQ